MKEQEIVHPESEIITEESALIQNKDLRSEKEKLSEMNWKEKLGYLVGYYGKTVLGVALGVGLVVYFIVTVVTGKDTVLSVMAVNTVNQGDTVANEESHYASVLSSCGIDPDSVEVSVSSDYGVSMDSNDSMNQSNVQAIQVRFMAGSVDVFLSDEDFFLSLAEYEYMQDLEAYLPEDVLARHEDELVYVTSEDTGEEYLAGIRLPADNAWLVESGWYDDGALVGMGAGTEHADIATALLLEILGENN